ncbi:MAG: GDSL-type esterase/lipase family protein [Microthrixaceae bacterium]
MTPRAKRASALFAGSVLALTSGCGWFRKADVILLGDSITKLIEEQVTRDVGDHKVAIHADWGLRLDQVVDEADALGSDAPDQVIINLGTNNVLQGYDPVSSVEDLRTIVDAFDGSQCITIVTVNDHMTYRGRDLSAGAIRFNQGIVELAGSNPRISVLDWNRLLSEHRDENPISADTVHPDPTGVRLLAGAYRSAILRCA